MSDPLFLPGNTHIEVRCVGCSHVVTLYPQDTRNIDQHEFEKRAKCSECGAGWPQVYRFPKPPSRWGLG